MLLSHREYLSKNIRDSESEPVNVFCQPEYLSKNIRGSESEQGEYIRTDDPIREKCKECCLCTMLMP